MQKSVLFLNVGILLAVFLYCSANADAQWRKADLTTFESYPTTEKECKEYNGCQWEGTFAFVNGKQTKDWVKSHNIIAIHSKHSKDYKLKTFKIRQGKKTITAKVYDECSDKDCKNCCTKNSKKTGFLIDLESYTAKKLGASSGTVEWMCVDC